MRGSAGEHSEADGGMYDISNRERMGLTEFQVCTVQRKGGGQARRKLMTITLPTSKPISV